MAVQAAGTPDGLPVDVINDVIEAKENE
jgi:hypothetical protein